MSLLLFDTTLLIDAEREMDQLDRVIADDDDVAIAAITLAELAVGVRLASSRRRPRRQAYLDAIVAAIPVLPYDERVAREHADLLVAARQSGRPCGAHDLIIAATAREHGRTIVSADGLKYTRNSDGEEMFYDLGSDPNELEDLQQSDPVRKATMVEQMMDALIAADDVAKGGPAAVPV